MNQLQVFTHKDFGQIRGSLSDGSFEMVLKDVCAAFGESNYRRVAARLDDDEKGVSQIATPGGMQNMIVVNESGLYSALFTMQPEKGRGVSESHIVERQEKLKQFKRWVTHEVLPSIHKTGGYIAGQEQMTGEQLCLAAVKYLENQIAFLEQKNDSKQERIDLLEPKAEFAEAVGDSKSLILIRDLAHLLKQNGVDIGEKRLFAWLRENGYLEKHRNEPTQRSLDLKVMRVVEGTAKSQVAQSSSPEPPRLLAKASAISSRSFAIKKRW